MRNYRSVFAFQSHSSNTYIIRLLPWHVVYLTRQRISHCSTRVRSHSRVLENLGLGCCIAVSLNTFHQRAPSKENHQQGGPPASPTFSSLKIRRPGTASRCRKPTTLLQLHHHWRSGSQWNLLRMWPAEDLLCKECVMIDISEFTLRPVCARVNMSPMTCS